MCLLCSFYRALIQRAGGFLRPLVPQLQISFCKALSDPAPQVRQAASMGITVLAELPTVRIDPLVYELVSNALTAQVIISPKSFEPRATVPTCARFCSSGSGYLRFSYSRRQSNP